MNEELKQKIFEATEGITELVGIHQYLEGNETIAEVLESLREDIDEVEVTSWQVVHNEDIIRLIRVLEKLL